MTLLGCFTVLDEQVIELVLGISDGVVQAEVDLEFKNELFEVVHPQGTKRWILHEKEVRIKPFEGHALQVRLRKGKFSMISTEGLGVVLEVQLTLH